MHAKAASATVYLLGGAWHEGLRRPAGGQPWLTLLTVSAYDYEGGGRYSRPVGAAARFVESAGVQRDATGEAHSTGLAAEYVTVASEGDVCDVRAPPLPAARVPVVVHALVSPPGLHVAPATALAPTASTAPVLRLRPVQKKSK